MTNRMNDKHEALAAATQANTRKTLQAGSLPEETVNALEKTKMDERHARLNELLQDQ
jgi:hypothetical protein